MLMISWVWDVKHTFENWMMKCFYEIILSSHEFTCFYLTFHKKLGMREVSSFFWFKKTLKLKGEIFSIDSKGKKIGEGKKNVDPSQKNLMIIKITNEFLTHKWFDFINSCLFNGNIFILYSFLQCQK